MSKDVPRGTLARLELFAAVLLRWNATLNLVAAGDAAMLWRRHVEDSLQLADLLAPLPERAIDIGSGGGFPGLVLAIATGVPFDLIESDRRKAAFLREAARATAAPVTVHAIRAEAGLAPAALVTARAVAPPPRLLALAHPLLAPGGVGLFPQGAHAGGDLAAARTAWHAEVERLPSRTDPAASILRIRNLAPRRAESARPHA